MVKTVPWYTAEDNKVCEFCEALDGNEIAIDENFNDAGATIGGAKGGSMTADYGDIGQPPCILTVAAIFAPKAFRLDDLPSGRHAICLFEPRHEPLCIIGHWHPCVMH